MDIDKELSPHFNLKEFRCKKNYSDCPYCNGAIRVKNVPVFREATTKLEILRYLLSEAYEGEVEIIVSSGDRCLLRNREVSHLSSPDSSDHYLYCAIDIFARIKQDRVIIPFDVLYDMTLKLWNEEDLLKEEDHLHITLE